MIPRSLITLLMVVAATLGVAAADHLYIEDFTINPGDTALVEILLENEVEYTAFQTDLYLPDGLTLDRQSVALTDRKGADHMIATNQLADGAIRLMSYSLSVFPYSGTDGALVAMAIIASETLNGPVVIELRNSRVTTPGGRETTLENSSCTVNTFLLGDVNSDGRVNVSDAIVLINYLINETQNGQDPSDFNRAAADFNRDGLINVSDASTLINFVLGSMG